MKRSYIIAIAVLVVIVVSFLVYFLTRSSKPVIAGDITLLNQSNVGAVISEGDRIEINFGNVTGIDDLVPGTIRWYRHSTETGGGVPLDWPAETTLIVPHGFCTDSSTTGFISAKVTFEDTVVSSVVYAVFPQNSVPLLGITGTAIIGNTLSYTLQDADGVDTVNTLWSSDSNHILTLGTAESFDIPMDYVPARTAGRPIYVKVNYIDRQGYTNFAVATAEVKQLPHGTLTIGNSFTGQIAPSYNEGESVQLRTDDLFITGSVKRISDIRWYRFETAGASGTELVYFEGKLLNIIPQAFVSGSQIQEYIQVTAVIEDDIGNRLIRSDKVPIKKMDSLPSNVPSILITGEPKEGSTLTASLGDITQITDEDGTPVSVHHVLWERETRAGSSVYETLLMNGYDLTIALDHGPRKVRFVAHLRDKQNHEFYLFSDTISIALSNDYEPSATVVISSTNPEEGQTVTATLSDVSDSDIYETFTVSGYQWQKSVDNGGSWTNLDTRVSSYMIPDVFGANVLRCAVQITSDQFGTMYDMYSDAVSVTRSNKPGSLQLIGDLTEGTLVAYVLSDADGSIENIVGHKWAKDESFAQVVGTSSSFQLPHDFVSESGNTLFLQVTYIDGQNFQAQVSAEAVISKVDNQAATGEPVFVVNTWAVGESVAVDVSSFRDSDGLPLVFQYKYMDMENRVLGTEPTYTIEANLLGTTLRCQLTVTDKQGYTTSNDVPESPVISEGVFVDGVYQEGQPLSVNVSLFGPAVVFSYAWTDSNNTILNTTQSYTVPLDFGENTLTVTVTGTNSDNQPIGAWTKTLNIMFGNQVSSGRIFFDSDTVFEEGQTVKIDHNSVAGDADGGFRWANASYDWVVNNTSIATLDVPQFTLPFTISTYNTKNTIMCTVSVPDGEGHIETLETLPTAITNVDNGITGTLAFMTNGPSVKEGVSLVVDTNSVNDIGGELLWDKATCTWYRDTRNSNNILQSNVPVNVPYTVTGAFSSAGLNSQVIVVVNVFDDQGHPYVLEAQATVMDVDVDVTGKLELVSDNNFKEGANVAVLKSSVDDTDVLDWVDATYAWFRDDTNLNNQLKDSNGMNVTSETYTPPITFVTGDSTTLWVKVNISDRQAHAYTLVASADIIPNDTAPTGTLVLVATGGTGKESATFSVKQNSVTDSEVLDWTKATYKWYKNDIVTGTFLTSSGVNAYNPGYGFSTVDETNRLVVVVDNVTDTGGANYTFTASIDVIHDDRPYDGDVQFVETVYFVNDDISVTNTITDEDGIPSFRYRWYKTKIDDSNLIYSTNNTLFGTLVDSVFPENTTSMLLWVLVTYTDEQGTTYSIDRSVTVELKRELDQSLLKLQKRSTSEDIVNETEPNREIYEYFLDTNSVFDSYGKAVTWLNWNSLGYRWYKDDGVKDIARGEYFVPGYDYSTHDQPSTLKLEFTATDDYDTEYTGSVSIDILHVDRPIDTNNARIVVSTDTGDTNYLETKTYTFEKGSVSDPDNGINGDFQWENASYTWYQNDDAVIDTNNECTPGYGFSTASQSNTLSVMVSVPDGQGYDNEFKTTPVKIYHVDRAPSSMGLNFTANPDIRELIEIQVNRNSVSDDDVLDWENELGNVGYPEYTWWKISTNTDSSIVREDSNIVGTDSNYIPDNFFSSGTQNNNIRLELQIYDKQGTLNSLHAEATVKDIDQTFDTNLLQYTTSDPEVEAGTTVQLMDPSGIYDADVLDWAAAKYQWQRGFTSNKVYTDIHENYSSNSNQFSVYEAFTFNGVDALLRCKIDVSDENGHGYTILTIPKIVKAQDTVPTRRIVNTTNNVQNGEGLVYVIDTNTTTDVDGFTDTLQWGKATYEWYKDDTSSAVIGRGSSYEPGYMFSDIETNHNLIVVATVLDGFDRETSFGISIQIVHVDRKPGSLNIQLTQSSKSEENAKMTIDLSSISSDPDGLNFYHPSNVTKWYKESDPLTILGSNDEYTPPYDFSVEDSDNILVFEKHIADSQGEMNVYLGKINVQDVDRVYTFDSDRSPYEDSNGSKPSSYTEGGTIKVDSTVFDDLDGNLDWVNAKYEWRKDDNVIPDATSISFDIPQNFVSDAESAILTCIITVTDMQNHKYHITTQGVTIEDAEENLTGDVVLVEAKFGFYAVTDILRLTDTTKDVNGIQSKSYQWYSVSNGAGTILTGATRDIYILNDNNIGQRFKCVVTVTDKLGTVYTLETGVSTPVRAANVHQSISGYSSQLITVDLNLDSLVEYVKFIGAGIHTLEKVYPHMHPDGINYLGTAVSRTMSSFRIGGFQHGNDTLYYNTTFDMLKYWKIAIRHSIDTSGYGTSRCYLYLTNVPYTSAVDNTTFEEHFAASTLTGKWKIRIQTGSSIFKVTDAGGATSDSSPISQSSNHGVFTITNDMDDADGIKVQWVKSATTKILHVPRTPSMGTFYFVAQASSESAPMTLKPQKLSFSDILTYGNTPIQNNQWMTVGDQHRLEYNNYEGNVYTLA